MSLLAAAMEQLQAHPQVINKFCETLRPDLIFEDLKATGVMFTLKSGQIYAATCAEDVRGSYPTGLM